MKTCAIIIAAYNADKYILECYNSVKNQIPLEGYSMDVRIGVDGCPKTAGILRKNKIPFYYSYNNVGAYVMRNSLMTIAPADYYLYFDADDTAMPNMIKRCLENIHTGIVIPAKIQCNQDMEPIKDKPIIEKGGAMCFTHEVLKSVGGFREYRCACDTDFIYRVIMAGYQICKIDHALYKRRRHEKSLTKSGMTAFGGKYRKEVWKKMTEERERGIVKIVPQRIELYFTN